MVARRFENFLTVEEILRIEIEVDLDVAQTQRSRGSEYP